MVRIERFVGPHEGHQFFGVRKVDDVVGVSGDHFHHFDLLAADLEVDHLVRPDLTQPDQTVTTHHHKFFILGVMPMLSLGYARLRDVHRELASIRRADDLSEAPPVVRLHLYRIDELLFRKIRQIGRIELLRERITQIRNREVTRHLLERIKQIDNPTQGYGMNHRNGTIVPFAVFAPRQGGDQLVHHVIYIDKVHHHLRIIHLDRQVVRDIVTESRHCTVIVRAAPFPEHIRKTIDQDSRTRLFGILEQKVLSRPLRLAIRIIQCSLRRR